MRNITDEDWKSEGTIHVKVSGSERYPDMRLRSIARQLQPHLKPGVTCCADLRPYGWVYFRESKFVSIALPKKK